VIAPNQPTNQETPLSNPETNDPPRKNASPSGFGYWGSSKALSEEHISRMKAAMTKFGFEEGRGAPWPHIAYSEQDVVTAHARLVIRHYVTADRSYETSAALHEHRDPMGSYAKVTLYHKPGSIHPRDLAQHLAAEGCCA
jgi:hypothetical protein